MEAKELKGMLTVYCGAQDALKRQLVGGLSVKLKVSAGVVRHALDELSVMREKCRDFAFFPLEKQGKKQAVFIRVKETGLTVKVRMAGKIFSVSFEEEEK